MNSVENHLNEEVGDTVFEGRVAGAADFANCAPPEACRRMTIRPSECAEKIASTTTSTSELFVMVRGRCCLERAGTGAAVCGTGARDV